MYHLHNHTKRLWVPILKLPTDMWIYHEIIEEIKPDLIIETWTYLWWSALFMANICDLLGIDTKIVSIDIEHRQALPVHDRITWLKEDSTTQDLSKWNQYNNILVILDSDHTQQHVYKELVLYSQLKPTMIIVEDTCINWNPVLPSFWPWPMEALDQFLSHNQDYIIDETKEKFIATQNPRWFLKKK